MFYLGADIGSISVNTVLINDNFDVLEEHYDYNHGKPFDTLAYRLSEILKNHPNISGPVAFTGTGSKIAAELLDGISINEIVAQSKAVMTLYPQVRTIIEIGGEDSKLIFLDKNEMKAGMKLSDFTMNSLCAAGTGSFLDQQAKRIGVSIENEFGELALKSVNSPRIAGLCFAVARNFKSTLGKGKDLVKPIIFQGGVAANKGMIRAFSEIYNLQPDELLVPKHFASMGAIGAIFTVLESKVEQTNNISLDRLNEYLEKGFENAQHLPRLINKNQQLIKDTFALNGQ